MFNEFLVEVIARLWKLIELGDRSDIQEEVLNFLDQRIEVARQQPAPEDVLSLVGRALKRAKDL